MASSLLVITGMAREVRLASGPGTKTIASGGDTARLRAVLRHRGKGKEALVLSFGVAGGLDPGLPPGALLIGTDIEGPAEAWSADQPLTEKVLTILRQRGLAVTSAPLAGVDRPVLSASEKAELRDRTGAAAVDMESHVAAAYAAEHRLPFLAIRAVCDPAERSLPPLVASALKPDGGTDYAAIIQSLIRHPGQLRPMLQLARDAEAAFGSLRRCRDLLGIGRGGANLVELLRDVA